MPFYQYEAQDEFGRAATGLLEAATPAGLRDQLAAAGFRLTSFEAKPDSTVRIATPNSATQPSMGGMPGGAASLNGVTPHSATTVHTPPRQRASAHCLSTRAHSLLFRELAAAIRSGLSAFQAAEMIAGRFKSGPLFQLMSWVRDQVRNGSTLADAISTSPVTLNESSLGIIRAGERGGFLPFVLDELASSYERYNYLQGRTFFPKLMYIGGVLPLLLLVYPVGDVITGAVAANQQREATIGQTLASGGHYYVQGLLHFSLPVACLLIALWLCWRLYTRTPAGELFAAGLGLKMPAWGKMERALSIARFIRVLGLLYKGGVPLRDAWELSAASVPNGKLAAQLKAQTGLMASGRPISEGLRSSGLFGPEEVSMVATGEQTGEVDAMLFRLAAYEDEIVERTGRAFPIVLHALLAVAAAPLTIIVIYHVAVVYMRSILTIADG